VSPLEEAGLKATCFVSKARCRDEFGEFCSLPARMSYVATSRCAHTSLISDIDAMRVLRVEVPEAPKKKRIEER